MEANWEIFVGGGTFVLGILGFCYRLFSGLVKQQNESQKAVMTLISTQMELLREMRDELAWLHDKHTSTEELCALSTPSAQRDLAREIADKVKSG